MSTSASDKCFPKRSVVIDGFLLLHLRPNLKEGVKSGRKIHCGMEIKEMRDLGSKGVQLGWDVLVVTHQVSQFCCFDEGRAGFPVVQITFSGINVKCVFFWNKCCLFHI